MVDFRVARIVMRWSSAVEPVAETSRVRICRPSESTVTSLRVASTSPTWVPMTWATYLTRTRVSAGKEPGAEATARAVRPKCGGGPLPGDTSAIARAA